jgi:hypothetical protein
VQEDRGQPQKKAQRVRSDFECGVLGPSPASPKVEGGELKYNDQAERSRDQRPLR